MIRVPWVKAKWASVFVMAVNTEMDTVGEILRLALGLPFAAARTTQQHQPSLHIDTKFQGKLE